MLWTRSIHLERWASELELAAMTAVLWKNSAKFGDRFDTFLCGSRAASSIS